VRSELLRWGIDQANGLIAWTKKSRRVRPRGETVKVNFGSSLVVVDGWFNVDASPHVLFAQWPKPFLTLMYRASNAANWCGDRDTYLRQLTQNRFIHHNLEYGLPFETESVDYIFSSHVLEHFGRDLAERILADAYRALKKGGRCRICVPDLRHAFRLYQEGRREQALAYFFLPANGAHHQHRYMYDFELLASLLSAVGFHSVERCNYRCGHVPDLDRLDNRPDETLYVECSK
jgi:SAM-dependent methyltransferase